MSIPSRSAKTFAGKSATTPRIGFPCSAVGPLRKRSKLMRHRLALLAVVGAATICGGGRAVAQLAVIDTAREATETSIADCMTKVNASKHQEVAPAQGVTGSMVSPGQGATVSSAGQTAVSGVGTPVSTGTVSGMKLS